MVLADGVLVNLLAALGDHEVELVIGRLLGQHDLVGGNNLLRLNQRLVGVGVLFVLLVGLLVHHLHLELLLQLGDRELLVLDFVPVLFLLVLDLADGLDQLVSLGGHLLEFIFVLFFCILHLQFQLTVLLLQCLDLRLRLGQLVLSIVCLLLRSVHFGPKLRPALQILHPLLQHVVD